MTHLQLQVTQLHATYQRITGYTISIIQREYAWAEWIRRGLTVEDLALWLHEIKRRQAKGGKDSLQFTPAIGNMDRAEENIVELRRLQRGWRAPTDRDSVLLQTGRTETFNSEPKRAGDVVTAVMRDPDAAAKAFAELKRFRESL